MAPLQTYDPTPWLRYWSAIASPVIQLGLAFAVAWLGFHQVRVERKRQRFQDAQLVTLSVNSWTKGTNVHLAVKMRNTSSDRITVAGLDVVSTISEAPKSWTQAGGTFHYERMITNRFLGADVVAGQDLSWVASYDTRIAPESLAARTFDPGLIEAFWVDSRGNRWRRRLDEAAATSSRADVARLLDDGLVGFPKFDDRTLDDGP